MGAAVDGVDGIREGINRFSVGICVLHHEFDPDVIDFFLAINRLV